MKKTASLSGLILTFMKIGLFTFGGGYAMISLIDNECVGKKKWITHDELMDIIIIAESTPGPIAINCATYVGYRQAGFPGAVLSTTSIVLPSFVVIYLISLFFDNILEITVISNAFKGMKISVGVLILNVAIKMLKKMHKIKQSIIIFASVLIISLHINFFKLNFSTIYMIFATGLIGYLTFILGMIKDGNGGDNK